MTKPTWADFAIVLSANYIYPPQVKALISRMAESADMNEARGPGEPVMWKSDAKVLELLNELAAGSSGLARQARKVLRHNVGAV